MNFIVTGGAGFIGSNLVDELIKSGHKVRIIDNLSTGKKGNINPLADFHEIDIRNLDGIQPLFKGAHGVFHLAAVPNVQTSIEKPVETNDINTSGTLNVLVSAQKAGVKRIVFSASSAAYGDPVSLPLSEEMKPNPKSPYGLQKLIGEEYCKLFSEVYDIETVSLRYFNAYGPRMTDEGAYFTVISVFLKQKAGGKLLTITGDGTQTRDFVHVLDIVEANILAMENEKLGKGEVINIGTGKNYSVNHIASLVGGETINLPARIEPHDTLANIERANNLLNWKPTISLEEGINELIK
ncbi:MAG: NAD-dependent epimerase/dehydratase family protein [Parcubacteria group bacterium]|nr:NAD-dependent epimerase/dehydratase family protein [Parcubacteria group bacterium]